MKYPKKVQAILLLSLGALPLLSSAGHAAVVSNTLIDDASYAGQDAAITTSLVTAGQSSLASMAVSRTPDLGFAAAGLNDGVSNAAQPLTTMTYFEDLRTPVSITFQLTSGYNITSLTSLAGWTDTFFGSQQFTVAFETGNSGVFTSLTGVFGQTPYTPPAPQGFPQVNDQNFATKTTVSDDAGFLATNVTGIRITYQDAYPTFAQFNGIVLHEISVTGTAVPEAHTALLAMLPALAAVARRRRSRE